MVDAYDGPEPPSHQSMPSGPTDGLPTCAPCIARCRAALSNETSAEFDGRRGGAVMNVAPAMWGTVTVVIVVVRTVVRSWSDNEAAAKP
jgi:hypothetical protein